MPGNNFSPAFLFSMNEELVNGQKRIIFIILYFKQQYLIDLATCNKSLL